MGHAGVAVFDLRKIKIKTSNLKSRAPPHSRTGAFTQPYMDTAQFAKLIFV
jgi:hypothetical protein